jgi:hypothetical protein
MPKFGTHILIVQVAATRQPDVVGNVSNATRLGAVGPDLTLFLFDPFLKNPTVRRGFDFALDALRNHLKTLSTNNRLRLRK